MLSLAKGLIHYKVFIVTMPRKRSRLVVVDDVKYRWVLSTPVWDFLCDRQICVELAEEPRSTLTALPTDIEWDFGDDYVYEITPALIETGIRKAIQAGWVPESSGTFRMPGDS